MFGLCQSQPSPAPSSSSSSVFLFPVFQCCPSSSASPVCTSGSRLVTSSTPSARDSDVITPPEVDDKLHGSTNETIFAADYVSSDVDVADVDVMTSPTAGDSSLADDDEVTCRRRHDDVTVTSPSRELKFGIERILIKNDDVKHRASPTGMQRHIFLPSARACRVCDNITFVEKNEDCVFILENFVFTVQQATNNS